MKIFFHYKEEGQILKKNFILTKYLDSFQVINSNAGEADELAIASGTVGGRNQQQITNDDHSEVKWVLKTLYVYLCITNTKFLMIKKREKKFFYF